MQTIDTYTISTTTEYLESSRKRLTLLYQPIIGKEAMALYLTLYSEMPLNQLYQVASTHYRLLQLLDTSLESLETSRYKLEAVGLIETYLKEETSHNYHYKLKQPLSAYQFFNHPLLSVLLYRIMGRLEFEKTKQLFVLAKPQLEGYTLISKRFDEVFSLNLASDEGVHVLIDKMEVQHQEVAMVDVYYDTTLFDIHLKTYQIKSEHLDEAVIKMLGTLSFMYELEASDAVKLLALVYDGKTVDTAQLKKEARHFYQQKIKPTKLTKIYHTHPLKYHGQFSNHDDKRPIKRMETLSPFEYLRHLVGHTPSTKDLTVLESVLERQAVEPGVLNVIVDYVYKKNHRLTKGYIESIAATMASKKINSVDHAMIEIMKSEQHKKQYDKPKENKQIDYVAYENETTTTTLSFEEILNGLNKGGHHGESE